MAIIPWHIRNREINIEQAEQEAKKKMKKFTVTLTYVVDAHDYDEAVEIAKVVKTEIERDSGYKLRDVEVQTIEEN